MNSQLSTETIYILSCLFQVVMIQNVLVCFKISSMMMASVHPTNQLKFAPLK